MRLWPKNMTKKIVFAKIKGVCNLLIGVFFLSYAGLVYRADGFSLGLFYLLLLCLAVVSPQFTRGLRRLGTLWGWSGMGAGLVGCWITADDFPTALLLWSLVCAIPLGLSCFWPLYGRIRPLAKRALPVSGGIAFLGSLLYSKLHFGSWSFEPMMKQIALRISNILLQTEQMVPQIYDEKFVAEYLALSQQMRQSPQQMHYMAFTVVLMVIYGLFGLFFWCVWRADRKAGADGLGRTLGSWHTMIPQRTVSWVFMGCYLILLLFEGTFAQNLIAVLDLFGFLYVFTALYHLLQLLRKKNLPPLLCGGIVGALFVVSFLTVGGGMISPYLLLMYVGWWIATSPFRIVISQ